jgi:hypothetical protein
MCPLLPICLKPIFKSATKCFLRSRGEIGTGNTYANWVTAEQLSYSSEGIKHLVEGVAEDECVTGAIDSKELRSPKWRLAIQTIARTQNLESSIHAIERLISEEGGKSAQCSSRITVTADNFEHLSRRTAYRSRIGL